MLHAHTFPDPVPTDFALHPPVAPWTYLRLRRQAAGLSIDQAAERIEPRHRQRAAVAAMLRTLEAEGVTARHVSLLDPIHAAYPFDAGVYFQLMTAPADRHPEICRACGCSAHDRCQHEQLGECDWTLPGLCIRCADGERC